MDERGRTEVGPFWRRPFDHTGLRSGDDRGAQYLRTRMSRMSASPGSRASRLVVGRRRTVGRSSTGLRPRSTRAATPSSTSVTSAAVRSGAKTLQRPTTTSTKLAVKHASQVTSRHDDTTGSRRSSGRPQTVLLWALKWTMGAERVDTTLNLWSAAPWSQRRVWDAANRCGQGRSKHREHAVRLNSSRPRHRARTRSDGAVRKALPGALRHGLRATRPQSTGGPLDRAPAR